jgi:hypothetical protein
MPFAQSGTDRGGKSGIFRKPKQGVEDGQYAISNVFRNAILPLSSGVMVKGSLTYVALEVVVSKLLRRISGAHDKGLIELAVVHTMSLALMGGVGASMTSPGETLVPYGTKGMKQHVKQGLKGVPALFLANYIYNTFFYGFLIGGFSMRDAMITAAAKILTRPIASKLYPMTKFTQNAFDSQQFMEQCQMFMSNFGRIAKGDLYIKPGNK